MERIHAPRKTNSDKLDDFELQNLFEANGDNLNELYKRLMPEVLDEAKRYLTRNTRDALPGLSAVVHSVLLSTFENPNFWKLEFENDEGVRQMLFEATVRHCRKHNRRWERHRERSINQGRSTGNDSCPIEPVAPGEYKAQIGQVYGEMVECLMSRLSERQQKILLLEWERANAGQRISQQQIADQLGVSKRSVQLDWAQIKKIGKQLMESEENGS